MIQSNPSVKPFPVTKKKNVLSSFQQSFLSDDLHDEQEITSQGRSSS